MATPAQNWGYRNPAANRDAYAFLRGTFTRADNTEQRVAALEGQVSDVLGKLEHISAQVETLRRIIVNG